jgi:hypothetical protein
VKEGEEDEGREMRHIRINTSVVDVWLVKFEMPKCSSPNAGRGVASKMRVRGVLLL